ncbi:Sas10 C-terminal domain-containing protein [Toxoplasma gondii TgCatPRC2]|uniref:Sas10 C-terminal domain-containing protein n=7 Tax=Toxoplasma gondii TaxID=5811 RepID=A0A125YFQ7_TOXGV|nr:Sas10 C-terminal domain-containing protein [Toxoplasma gondii ME49]ESS28257.1 Sas10 C-terminal domain-containing protein [Toxoplasma gondii VEG]KFG29314.1 Sas10 C-terminal domain-containing protein [Toxoplasma gondii GAB2-2007-GAL-DOM2]KFG31776.1 Sas10 C-terminal domain-containing protein [Toxoplasma gondii FOU]KYF40333.1 Sas10 C-terminal domain-containing protein [Toxoplasma gondii ARI]KYK62346.1 Sas10 C-terminal domain-containing protein [Toxoplasma gondii TgCatPRC2]PUA83348.1 Sas10 C-te|eukprot:XP_002364844.1 Sas10 C-terminal domain-containing protein [Toxoplasma gondii ME49]
MARLGAARRPGPAGKNDKRGNRSRGSTALHLPAKFSKNVKKGTLFETEADQFGLDEVEESYRCRERRKLGGSGSAAEEFIRLGDKGDDESDEEHERRLMGLEGAEDALDDDDQELEEEEEDAEEDEEEAEDEVGARTAWGRSAKAFYADEDEEEEAESAEEEENMRMREEEARQIEEEEEVEGLDEDDFGLSSLAEAARGQRKAGASTRTPDEDTSEDDESEGSDQELHSILSGFEAASSRAKETAHVHLLLSSSEFQALSEQERQKILTEEHPELQSLLDQLKTSLQDVRGTVRPLLRKAKCRQLITKEGLSFLDTKNQLLVAYLTYLSYYVLLKTHGIPVTDHPVIERLVEVRLLLEKLKPIDDRLRLQINRLLQLAKEKNVTDVEGDEDVAAARPRPDLLLGVGEERHDGEASTEEEEDSEKPKGKKANKADDDEGTQLYKPPKILAMEYHAEDQVNKVKAKAERELRRAAERLKRSELVRAVREEVGDAPEEVGLEQWIQVQQSRLGSAASIAKQRAREAFEEENMVRLSMSKKDRKERQMSKKLEEHQRRMTVGTTLGELTAFSESTLDALGDDEEDPTLGRANKSKKKQKNALNAYLNAAKQASETARRAEAALQADRAILSRQENQKTLSFNLMLNKQKKDQGRQVEDDGEFEDVLSGKARKGKRMEESEARAEAPYREEDLDAFDELLETQKIRKTAKKKQMVERAKAFIPSVPEAVDGQRATTRQILKNKGLTRKRKKFEGNARVHNRMKFESKMKKLKTIRPPGREVEGDSYMGEESGIRTNLKKSRTLS